MSASSDPVIPRKYLYSFILTTTLFALWGFANDVTNPLVAVFKDVFVISDAQSSWVQMAFYGGYATMAIPAALFIRKFSYKRGIIMGLFFYALGAMLSIPAAAGANFNLFIVALYVLTFGLAFLETTANPYILSMGPASTATRRLNLAQAFNPVGTLTGMTMASLCILNNIHIEDFKHDLKGFASQSQVVSVAKKEDVHHVFSFLKGKERERANDAQVRDFVVNTLKKSPNKEVKDVIQEGLESYKEGEIVSFQGLTHQQLQKKDLRIVATPYIIIGCVVIGFMGIFLFSKLPDTSGGTGERSDHELHLEKTLARLFSNKHYLFGVVAQTFYVGAQIMCWTFIIQYAERELGLSKATAQNHNILAMIFFFCSRLICTFFLKYITPGRLLALLSLGGGVCTLGAIYLEGMAGLYSLMAVSACMSLMFPTIYGLALDGLGEDAKLGSAGLIFAIVGGAIMPRLQGGIMDLKMFMGVSSTRGSFFLPLLCFVVIACYGVFCFKTRQYTPDAE